MYIAYIAMRFLLTLILIEPKLHLTLRQGHPRPRLLGGLVIFFVLPSQNFPRETHHECHENVMKMS
jgi:hypothetical protein